MFNILGYWVAVSVIVIPMFLGVVLLTRPLVRHMVYTITRNEDSTYRVVRWWISDFYFTNGWRADGATLFGYRIIKKKTSALGITSMIGISMLIFFPFVWLPAFHLHGLTPIDVLHKILLTISGPMTAIALLAGIYVAVVGVGRRIYQLSLKVSALMESVEEKGD